MRLRRVVYFEASLLLSWNDCGIWILCSASKRATPPRRNRSTLAALRNSAETFSSFSNHHLASSASDANSGTLKSVIFLHIGHQTIQHYDASTTAAARPA